MESRKIIKFGKNSYVLTLPHEWMQKNKLNKGDLLFLREMQNGIFISSSSEYKQDENKSIINTDNKTKFEIQREIVVAYVNDSKVIELVGKDVLSQSSDIVRFIKNFMSLEVIEQLPEKIVIRDFLNFKDISLTTTTKRIDNIIRLMIEDCKRILEGDEKESILQSSQIISRFYFLTYRIVRSGLSDVSVRNSLGMSSISLLEHWEIKEIFRRICGECKSIYYYAHELGPRKKKEREDIQNFLKTMDIYYRDIMKAYYTNDKLLSHRVRNDCKNFVEELNSYIDKNRSSTIPFLVTHIKYFTTTVMDLSRHILNNIY